MILNNFKESYKAQVRGTYDVNFTTTAGKQQTSYQALLYPPLLAAQMINNAALIFGKDNTVEDGTSYCLKSVISTSSYSVTKSNQCITNDDGTVSVVIIANITNTSSTAFTVGEVGITQNVKYSGSTATSLLMDRTPLETPLTLQPGDIGRITYTITMT